MKKAFTLLIAIVLFSCFGLVACKEYYIPKTLGEPEGLYVYYDNYRSLTNGQQVETLLSEITVDGITYDNFNIVDLKYITENKEIVYSLEFYKTGAPERTYCIWHYNYDTKTSGLVMVTNDYVEDIQLSNNYIYLGFLNGQGGVLLDKNFNLIEDGFSGRYYLYNDYLVRMSYTSELSWWKDGRFHELNTYRSVSEMCFTDDYIYTFAQDVMCMINMNTDEYGVRNFYDNEVVRLSHGSCAIGDKVYFITSSNLTQTNYENSPLQTGCKLYCVEGFNVTCLYEFNQTYQVSFYASECNEEYLNFGIRKFIDNLILADRVDDFKGYFDLEQKTFVDGKSKKILKEKETFKIGEYEFYTRTERCLCAQNGYCYYLHRITNGKDEIMQYHFGLDTNAPNPILFEDICAK